MIANKKNILFLITPNFLNSCSLYNDIINGIKELNPDRQCIVHNLEDKRFYLGHKYIYDKLTSMDYKNIIDSGFLKEHDIDYTEVKLYDRNNIFALSLLEFEINREESNEDALHIVIGFDNANVLQEIIETERFEQSYNHSIIILNDYNNIEKVGYNQFMCDIYDLDFAYQVICYNEQSHEQTILNIADVLDMVFVKGIGSADLEDMALDFIESKNYRVDDFNDEDMIVVSTEKKDVKEIDYVSGNLSDYSSLKDYIAKKIEYLYSTFSKDNYKDEGLGMVFDYYLYGTDIITNLKVIG